MDCICLMAGKLVRFVPIFELEDSLLCPLLGAMVEYLKEVLSLILGTEEENRMVFFSLVCTLVEQTENVCGEALHAAGVWGGGGAQPVQGVAQDSYQHLLLPASSLPTRSTEAEV